MIDFPKWDTLNALNFVPKLCNVPRIKLLKKDQSEPKLAKITLEGFKKRFEINYFPLLENILRSLNLPRFFLMDLCS